MTWRIHNPKNGLWFEVTNDDGVTFELARESSAKDLVSYLSQPLTSKVKAYLRLIAHCHVEAIDTDDEEDAICKRRSTRTSARSWPTTSTSVIPATQPKG